MATSSEITKNIDVTTCPICLEEFKTPKCLPCLHNFCETCLNSYIISAFKNESESKFRKSQFNCPVCREQVTPPDPKVAHQDWAKQFRTNHLIVSLIDQNKPKSKQKLCDPCKSTDDDVTAVSWCHDCNKALCQMCVNAHKKLKVSKDHNLKNIEELEGVPVITSVQSCENHKGKIVVAFCRDHNQSCCATCVAIHHRKCDHVTTLEEAANDILESKELLDLLERLKSTSDLNKDIVTTTMINVIEKPSISAAKYPKPYSPKRMNLKECTPQLVSSISIKDKCGVDTSVYGGCFMSDNKLLLPLYDVQKLALFNSNGDLIKQSGQLSGRVYDVCILDPSTVVVTRCRNSAIYYINIPTLTVNKTVSLGVTCYGITSSDNKLYVGCKNKLMILDKDGNEEKEINTNGCIFDVTIINQGEKKIVYTNYDNNSCHFVRDCDLQEIERFTHNELKYPCGVTSDREGNVYIAGISSGNVFQLSSDGNLLRVLLQGLDRPCGIQFNGDTDRFFISYSDPAKVNIYNMIKPSI